MTDGRNSAVMSKSFSSFLLPLVKIDSTGHEECGGGT